MKIRILSLICFSAVILAAGCTFPRLGPVTRPPVSTPLPQSTPTFPLTNPPPTVEPTRPIDDIPLLAKGDEITISTIQMISVNNGWAIGNTVAQPDAHILLTTDGGNTWKDVTPPETGVLNVGRQATAFFMSESSAWVAYETPNLSDPLAKLLVWHTSDGGKTWSVSQPLDPGSGGAEFFFPSPITFADATHGWLLAHVGVGMSHDYVMLFSTQDGGHTWTRLLDPFNEHGMSMVVSKTGMVFTDPLHGWVTGDSMGLTPGQGYYPLQTSDGGANWSLLPLTVPVDGPTLFTDPEYFCGFHSPQFLTPQSGLFQMNCSNIDANFKAAWVYFTTNGGAAWSAKPLPSGIGDLQFLNPNLGWYVANGRISKTTNGGTSWNQTSTVTWSGTPDFVDDHNGWIVAQKDNALALVKSSDGGVTWALLTPVIAQ